LRRQPVDKNLSHAFKNSDHLFEPYTQVHFDYIKLDFSELLIVMTFDSFAERIISGFNMYS